LRFVSAAFGGRNPGGTVGIAGAASKRHLPLPAIGLAREGKCNEGEVGGATPGRLPDQPALGVPTDAVGLDRIVYRL